MSSMRAFSRTSAMSSSRIRPVMGGATRRSLCRATRCAAGRSGACGRTLVGGPTAPAPVQDGVMTFSDHAHTDEQTLGALVHDLSQQIPELIRSELRLAQAEVAEKGKRAGLGL